MPVEIDWSLANSNETDILMNIMEGLVECDKDLKITPFLAESWIYLKMGLFYTFHLRPGVLWSDGVPLKAGDFLFSWRRLLDPATKSPFSYYLYGVKNARNFREGKISALSKLGLEAPDDRTFRVTLEKPMPYFIYLPTFWLAFS